MDQKYLKILLVILVCLSVYSLFSLNTASKKIKTLTKEATVKVDSLKLMNKKYESLETDYQNTYSELRMTREKLGGFKSDLNTIMEEELRTVSQMRKMVNKLIKQTEELRILPSDSTNFRFK